MNLADANCPPKQRWVILSLSHRLRALLKAKLTGTASLSKSIFPSLNNTLVLFCGYPKAESKMCSLPFKLSRYQYVNSPLQMDEVITIISQWSLTELNFGELVQRKSREYMRSGWAETTWSGTPVDGDPYAVSAGGNCAKLHAKRNAKR